MPSKSKKQHNLMEAVAHDPGFAKKKGIPQSVGRDYVDADKGKSEGKKKSAPKREPTLGDLYGKR